MRTIGSTPFIIMLLSGFLAGCNHLKEHSTSKSSASYIVDFEQCMNTERTMRLSEIADTIEFLELKTPKETIITRIWDIFPTHEFLFIFSRDGVFQFTKNGDYIRKIGRDGQGPGEYTLAIGTDIDFGKQEIVISDVAQKLLFYDFDGNFLREEKWGYLFNIGCSDSVIWVSEFVNQGCKYIAFALNSKGDTIASILNPHYGMKSKDLGTGASMAKYLKPFYRYKGDLYLKGKEVNDTVYQIFGKNHIPYTIFNMGKYKLPVEYEAWYSYDDHYKFGKHYWNVIAVGEDDKYLFLTSQRCAPIDENKYVHNEDNYRYIVYSKDKKKGFVTNGEQGTKIIDDILGGPAIWPRYITDDYYMYTVEWYELSEEIKNGKYNLAPALKEQFQKFGYSTNELIVMCRKKK
ncbi:6-bladed beta-propeller [Parabacteroides distasonis]|uniref:6-bladed beta-propeller n=1 Tax=Parabacteroides distasonis TaxID=823 RepID=UPI003F744E81